MSADVIARVRALAADFESRGDFATESDLLALCTAYAQVTAERDAWKQKATDEESAHALVAGALIGNERSLAKLDRYRVERDQARKQLATLRADLAAQVEGMDTLTIGSYGIVAENVRIVGKTQFVSRDEVLTLLRGPHAD